jgi:hypothetical protein
MFFNRLNGKSQMTPIRSVCLSKKRIDTHAHLAENYQSLNQQASQFQTFAGTESLFPSESRIVAHGCRLLYQQDVGVFFRPDSPAIVFDKATQLRSNGPWPAIKRALDKAGIEKQLVFCDFDSKDTRPFINNSMGQLAYLAYIDKAINSHSHYPSPDLPETDQTYYVRLCELLGPLNNLNTYLDTLDNEIDSWRSHGVVGMKTAIAYTSGLAISNPTAEEARIAFARKNDMTDDDFLIVRDFAFHHALQGCRRNNLPVVIHTGFQIWGHASLTQANPMLLHNILIDPRYRDLTFVLLHGGNPYVGETTYLASRFKNVILDFTWISWMTPGRFRWALEEWLLTIPHDRFCWGSDSSTPESIVGIDHIVRNLIADVLEQAIHDKIIDEKYAFEFIENSYCKTPKRIFSL